MDKSHSEGDTEFLKLHIKRQAASTGCTCGMY